MTTDAQRIRVIRAYTGYGAGEFAAKVGVSRQSLTDWERGRSTPGLRACKALAKIIRDAGLELRKDGYPVPIE